MDRRWTREEAIGQHWGLEVRNSCLWNVVLITHVTFAIVISSHLRAGGEGVALISRRSLETSLLHSSRRCSRKHCLSLIVSMLTCEESILVALSVFQQRHFWPANRGAQHAPDEFPNSISTSQFVLTCSLIRPPSSSCHSPLCSIPQLLSSSYPIPICSVPLLSSLPYHLPFMPCRPASVPSMS